MKWSENDAKRGNIKQRYLESGIESVFEGGAKPHVNAFETEFRGDDRQSNAAEGQGSEASGTGRNQGNNNRAPLSSRLRRVAQELETLSDEELTELGIDPGFRQAASFKPSETASNDSAPSEQSDPELTRLENAAKRSGKSIKVTRKVFDSPSDKPDSVVFADEIATAFGKSIEWVTSEGDFSFESVVYDGQIYVRAESKTPY